MTENIQAISLLVPRFTALSIITYIVVVGIYSIEGVVKLGTNHDIIANIHSM